MKKRSAFTLVELLVVIGIIALLISILLPSLNRARQSANVIKCESNLRQIGIMLSIYANQNKGFAPYGTVDRDYTTGVLYSYSGPLPPVPWSWQDTISILLDKQAEPYPGAVNTAKRMNKVLQDVDTVDTPAGASPGSHYMGNARIFSSLANFDPYNSKGSNIYRISNIKGSSNVYTVFDGAQDLAAGGNFGCAALNVGIDNYEYFYFHCLYYPGPPGQYIPPGEYDRLIALGSGTGATSTTPSGLRLANRDFDHKSSDGDNWTTVRYRHMKNTTANFLALDGHVESRKIGDLTVKDMCVPR